MIDAKSVTPVIGDIRCGKDSHKWVWLPCEKCGTPRWVGLRNGVPRFKLCQNCGTQGHLKELGQSTRFPKAIIPPQKTYKRVHCPGHPHGDAEGRVLLSRAVMEKHLGRYLLPEEVVHHKDLNWKNNDINNLMLFANEVEHAKHHYQLRMVAPV